MFYRILADITVFLHLLWILFLILGAFFGVRFKKVKLLHLGGLAFALVSQVTGWYCPLTHLEIWLRARHDPALTYAGSFITHYMEKLIYFELPAPAIFGLTILLACINVWVYTRKRAGKY